MTTDSSEKGLETLIMRHMTGTDGLAVVPNQCDGGKKKYGGITGLAELKANLRAHCLPLSLLDGEVPDYDAFLAERRTLMAKTIRDWFAVL